MESPEERKPAACGAVWTDRATSAWGVSIASNIVEGCTRSSEAEYLRFLDMAFGSAREVEYPVGLAQCLGCLSDAVQRELGTRSTEPAKELNGLLRSFRRQ